MTTVASSLKAPNRVSRESLLLSLGIANYCGVGRPADLTIETSLFPHTPPGVDIETDSYVRDRKGHDEHEDGLHSDAREVQVVSPVKEEEGEAETVGEASNTFERFKQGWMTPLALSPKTPGADAIGAEADARFQVLENELRSKIDKLFAKEKTCADLQRRVATTESAKKRSDETA